MRRKELESTARSVRSQVEEKVRTLSASQERVKLADAQLLLAEQTLAAEEALLEAGRSIYKDLLEARNEVASARGEKVKALKSIRAMTPFYQSKQFRKTMNYRTRQNCY